MLYMIEVITKIYESHWSRICALGALGRRFESCRPDWDLSDCYFCLCAKAILIKTYQFLVLLRKIRYVLNTDKGSEKITDNELETLNFSLY